MNFQPRRCAFLLAVCAACTVGPSGPDSDEDTGGPIVDYPGDGSENPHVDDKDDFGDGDGDVGGDYLDSGVPSDTGDPGSDAGAGGFTDGSVEDGGADDAGDGMAF